MSSFTSPLYLEDLGNRTFRLLKAFSYHVGDEESGNIIVVPENFITDFASVPRAFWAILPPYGQYGKAAVIHDYLYSTNGNTTPLHPHYTRRQCDEIFLEAMEVLEVPWHRRHIMFRAVRAFGWAAWNHAKKERGKHVKT